MSEEEYEFDFDNIVPPEIVKISEVKIKETKTKESNFQFNDNYKIAGLFLKERFDFAKAKVIPTTDKKILQIYNETKEIPKKIKKYTNYLFSEWQNKLIDYIHEGNNIILKIVTSGGKTWAINCIISYYTLSTNTTAIFIVPNSEIMRDNVAEIIKNNNKHYKNPGMHMVDTIAPMSASYDESSKPSSQIICLTTENFPAFIMNEENKR